MTLIFSYYDVIIKEKCIFGGNKMNIPRSEYPRPQLVRDSWQNLNGEWDFLFDFGNSGVEREFFKTENFFKEEAKKILVPFCPESRLSGIEYKDFIPAVWYHKAFNLDKENCKGRIILHFGAVDYHTIVYVNGNKAGEHKGGYTSFEFDITNRLVVGENHIVVYAEDDTRNMYQHVGKQCRQYKSRACDYTRTTGIWQTVWLEFVPKNYIKQVKITPFVDENRAVVDVKTVGGKKVSARASFDGKTVCECEAAVNSSNARLVLDIDDIKLWDIDDPNLYDLEITLDDCDCVKSYFGMRKVELKERGIYLNDKPVFMRLVLDQGFNPDGIYTYPDEEYLKRDIELSKELGFNGARLHMRVFEERTLYWADKLGYIVWGEYPMNGKLSDPAMLAVTLPEWTEAVERDYSHPSIIGWCPGNESYWWDAVPEYQNVIYDVTKTLDPYRPCIDAAGGIHFKTDMYDVHAYEQDSETLKKNLDAMLENPNYAYNPIHRPNLNLSIYKGQAYWASECGGAIWNPDNKEGWGYGNAPKTTEEFAERYEKIMTVFLENRRVCGFCYTQLTDIEQELNGLYKYDRTRKFPDEVYDIIRKTNLKKSVFEQENE